MYINTFTKNLINGPNAPIPILESDRDMLSDSSGYSKFSVPNLPQMNNSNDAYKIGNKRKSSNLLSLSESADNSIQFN